MRLVAWSESPWLSLICSIRPVVGLLTCFPLVSPAPDVGGGVANLLTLIESVHTKVEPSTEVLLALSPPPESEPGSIPEVSGSMEGWQTPSLMTSPAGRHLRLLQMDLAANCNNVGIDWSGETQIGPLPVVRSVS